VVGIHFDLLHFTLVTRHGSVCSAAIFNNMANIHEGAEEAADGTAVCNIVGWSSIGLGSFGSAPLSVRVACRIARGKRIRTVAM
jgi:hypothetical protein